MRAALGKELKREFAARLNGAYPLFRRCKTTVLAKGDSAFEWKLGTKLSLFVALLTYHNEDKFSIEVAWSEKGRFPDLCPDLPDEEPKDGEIKGRLCHFWSEEDIWWELAPSETLEEMVEKMDDGRFFDEFPLDKAMMKITPQVKDAISKLRKYAIPYFARIAAEHGYQLGET